MSAPIIADGAQVVTFALTQVGVRESPPYSNRQRYGAWYGMNGVPWCAIWVSYIFWFSNNRLPRVTTIKGFSYVPEIVRHARATGQWRSKTYRPKPGDLIVFSMGGRRADHVAIVRYVLPDGRIRTIEGNTNPAGSRTGGGVYELNRSLTKVIGFVSIMPKRSTTPPPKPAPRPPAPDSKDDEDMATFIRLNQPGHPHHGRVEAVGDFHRRWVPKEEYDLRVFLGGQITNVDIKGWNALTSNKQPIDGKGGVRA